QHFQSSLGFIMPNRDDFGIVAVEALAAGTPVVAYFKGGSQDYIEPNKTGLFFERQTAASLAKVLEACLSKTWDYESIAKQADKFSVSVFRKSIKDYINKCLEPKREA